MSHLISSMWSPQEAVFVLIYIFGLFHLPYLVLIGLISVPFLMRHKKKKGYCSPRFFTIFFTAFAITAACGTMLFAIIHTTITNRPLSAGLYIFVLFVCMFTTVPSTIVLILGGKRIDKRIQMEITKDTQDDAL